MSKSTVVGCAGRRIVVQPSKTSAGCVQIEILTADRSVAAIMTLDAESVGVLLLGLERAGVVAHTQTKRGNDNSEDQKNVGLGVCSDGLCAYMDDRGDCERDSCTHSPRVMLALQVRG